jgi:hypothetical protein
MVGCGGVVEYSCFPSGAKKNKRGGGTGQRKGWVEESEGSKEHRIFDIEKKRSFFGGRLFS